MTTAMRDSSTDYRTYWLQDGQYYSKMRNLGETSACELPADKLAQFSGSERKVILDEVSSNPALCQNLHSLMTRNPNWKNVVDTSMRLAVANALDRSRGSAGPWRKLQETVRTTVDEAFSSADQKVAAMTLGQKIQIAQAIAASGREGSALSGLEDVFGSLFSGISDYFGSKVLASAQKDIAKTQANAAIQVANSQVSIAQANAAIAAAQERISSPIAALTSTTIAGIPIIVPILGLVGLGLWFAFGRK